MGPGRTLEGREWENDTDDKLASVASELELGPGKEVLEELKKLEELMMQEETYEEDEKKAMATLENCFPVTHDTGEKHDKDVAQISHLKYIPTWQEGMFINRHVYQARSIDPEGEIVVLDLINPNWVRWCFEQNYCYYVMRLGIRQFAAFNGVVKRMSWVPVPLGAAREGCQDKSLLVQSVVVKYKQFEDDTCTFAALASALHYCASNLNMGDKTLASRIASGASGYAKGRNAPAQLDLCAKVVKENSSYF